MAAPDTGQENATTIKLTQEDVEKIKSLPKRTFLIGNLQQTGLYDEKTRRFYYLDTNGEWNGRLAIINTPPPPPRLLTRKNLKMRVPARRSQWMTAATAAMLQLPSLIRRRGFFLFSRKRETVPKALSWRNSTPPYQKECR